MPISEKQRQVLAFPYTHFNALICDGAIRSGKTSFMMIAFIDDAMRRYNGCLFGICGKTVDATRKNIITPYMSLGYAREKYSLKYSKSDKVLTVQKGDTVNFFEIFGGKDEASAALIQGRTLAGVLLDEVVLMPQSFVEQAIGRCSVEGARLWFSCNPGSPAHWFHEQWIQNTAEHNALYIHFDMGDNPSLSEATLARYRSMYKGLFYQRFVLGEWVLADGLVYDFFDADKHVTSEVPEYGDYYISIDYGTMNPFSAGLWCVNGKVATRIREFYYNGRKKRKQLTDEQYCEKVKELAEGIDHITAIVVDPSATSFITAMRQRGYYVKPAKNDVLDGIRRTAVYLQNGNIKIHESCKDCIAEFGLYRWDEKAKEDAVVKEYDHAMDDIRYFANTILRTKIKESSYVPFMR